MSVSVFGSERRKEFARKRISSEESEESWSLGEKIYKRSDFGIWNPIITRAVASK